VIGCVVHLDKVTQGEQEKLHSYTVLQREQKAVKTVLGNTK
jgi:hypothetical protein